MVTNPYESPTIDPADWHGEAEESLAPQTTGEALGMAFGSLFIVGLVVATYFNSTLQDAIRYRDFWPGMWPAFVTIVLDAGGVAAIGLAVWRKLRGVTTFPRQFGHWLLLLQGVSFLSTAAYMAIYNHYIAGRWEDPDIEAIALLVQAELRGVFVLFTLTTLGVGLLAVINTRGERLWHRYVVFLLVLYVWHLISTRGGIVDPFQSPTWFHTAISSLITLLAAVCLTLALARDYRRAELHDTLHWVGVGCHAIVLLLVVWNIFASYVQRSF